MHTSFCVKNVGLAATQVLDERESEFTDRERAYHRCCRNKKKLSLLNFICDTINSIKHERF